MSSLSPSHYKKVPINDDEEEDFHTYIDVPLSNDLPTTDSLHNSRDRISSKPLSLRNLSPPTPTETGTEEYKSLELNEEKDPYNSNSDDEDLGKYSIAFNKSLGRHGNISNPRSSSYRQRSISLSGHKVNGGFWSRESPVKRLYHRIQDARNETKRKRLERILALPDEATLHFHKERCALFFVTWCDLLDKGLFPLLLVLVVYIVILALLDEEYVITKKLMLIIGIPLFIFRFSWRPLCWVVSERRRKVSGDSRLFQEVERSVATDNQIQMQII